MAIVNLANKFGRLTEYWTPETFGEIGDVHIKLVKVKGDYMWHKHEKEDTLYYVLKGKLTLKFRDARNVVIDAGEFYIVKNNTEHLPTSTEETQLMIIEPKSVSFDKENADAITQIFMPEIDYLS